MAGKNNNLKVEKTYCLKGKIKAPPSKSYTIRAIIAASLNGKAKIINPLFSQDTEAAIGLMRALGATIRKNKGELEVRGFKGRPTFRVRSLNVGESGTLLRMALPIIALGQGKFLVKGEGTLLKRTNKPIAQALLSLGVNIKGKDSDFRLPILIQGNGQIKGGEVRVSAKISSQTISSLLTIAPLTLQGIKVIVEDTVVSKPYIDITIDVLANAGIKVGRKGYSSFFVKGEQSLEFKKDFIVGGDYSSAAFLIAACCLLESDVIITDMVKDKQGDRRIIDILNSMGAKIRHCDNEVRIKGPFKLRGIDIDSSDTPDLVPILSVVGCFAKGKTRILNIGHLAHKESNRILTPANELRKLGACIEAGRDSLTIKESVLSGARVSSCNDHRIAMSLAVAGLRAGGLTLQGAEAIGKSYPRFIADMRQLGAKLLIKRNC